MTPATNAAQASAVVVVLLAYLALLPVAVALHELGHAAAAHWLGLELRVIQSGAGRLWWERKFGTVTWRVKGNLLSGKVEMTLPGGSNGRRNYMLMIAAGPLVNIVAVIIGSALVFGFLWFWFVAE